MATRAREPALHQPAEKFDCRTRRRSRGTRPDSSARCGASSQADGMSQPAPLRNPTQGQSLIEQLKLAPRSECKLTAALPARDAQVQAWAKPTENIRPMR